MSAREDQVGNGSWISTAQDSWASNLVGNSSRNVMLTVLFPVVSLKGEMSMHGGELKLVDRRGVAKDIVHDYIISWLAHNHLTSLLLTILTLH